MESAEGSTPRHRPRTGPAPVVASFGPKANRRSRRWRLRPLHLLAAGAVLLMCMQLHIQAWLLPDRLLPGMKRAERAPPVPPEETAPHVLPPASTESDFNWEAGGTAPCLASLRQQMVASTGAGGGRTPLGLPAVPRRLHQTWKDAHPPRRHFSPRWRKSLQHANPGWQYQLWTDDENRALVAARYPWLLETYDAYPTAIQRADVARYLIVHTYGGVYADLDIQCFRPFAPLLQQHDASLLLSYKQGSNFSRGASNSIFGSTAHHPFWEAVFRVLLDRANTSLAGHRDVLFSTGPAVLREAVRRVLRLPPRETIRAPMLEQLHAQLGLALLDSRFLHPTTAEHRTMDSAEQLPPEALCTHHFVSSWVEHNASSHAATEQLRREGHALAAMEGTAQPVRRTTVW